MRIKKVSQTTPVTAQVVDGYSTSTTDAYSANYVNGLNTYSTTEQRVGTWTDGKPLYRRVFSGTFGTVTEGTESEVQLNVYSAAFCLVKYYWADRAQTNSAINQGYAQNTLYLGYTTIGSNQCTVRLRTNKAFMSNVTVYAIVEYTKTTD